MRRTGLGGLIALVALVGGVVLPPGRASAAPPNDDLASAAPVGALPFTDARDTTGATLEAGEPAAQCSNAPSATVWYRFMPSSDGKIEINTLGSSYDTVIAVYEGDTYGSLTLVGCNDDIELGKESLSRVFFQVLGGHTYSIQAGGYNGATGALSLTVDLQAPAPPPCPSCPTFSLHAVPDDMPLVNPNRAGETSIGVNPLTNAAMLLMRGYIVRATFDDTTEPATATWTDVSTNKTGLNAANWLGTTNDPILWTDQVTGRTYVAQLRAAAATAGSVIGITDDDGETWTPTEPGVVIPSWDHQTVGGGPYPGALGAAGLRQYWYCAQSGFSLSQCARSDDGGLTWGAPFFMNALKCSGLHGHVAVAPDGTVVVPHKACTDPFGRARQGILVSTDLGHTWTLRIVPGTLAARSDPKVAFDAAGRMYFIGSSGGKAVLSTSTDRGATWSPLVDAGAAHSVRNTEFPAVIAGDGGRAAAMWYGSTLPGDTQSSAFTGDWHVYAAFTYDGGATWDTVDVTPDDPVQRGCIWLQGGSNPCRNLLDFQDMTLDAHGRVLISIADGCISAVCVGPSGTPDDSRDQWGVIARQSGGKGLLAAYDGTL